MNYPPLLHWVWFDWAGNDNPPPRPTQVAGTVFLGLLNLVGVGFLSGLMADPRSAYLLAAQGLGFVPGLVGPLQLYAAAFFAIPALR